MAPARPVAVARHRQQALVVLVAVRFKKRTHVEHGALNHAVLPQKQRHQHAPQAAVAIQERVQRLKLGVQDRQLHQAVGGVAMQVLFPGAHGIGQLVGANRHKARLLHRAASRTDPIGNAPILAWRLALAAYAIEQYLVRLAHHALRQRHAGQQLLGHAHGGAVVEHLADIVAARLAQFRGTAFGLKLQHLAHGGLGAFDARGQHRFLRGQWREQHRRVGDGRQRAVVSRHRRRGRPQQRDQLRPVQRSRRKLAQVIVDGHHASLALRPRAFLGLGGGSTYRSSSPCAMASDLSVLHFSRTRSGQ